MIRGELTGLLFFLGNPFVSLCYCLKKLILIRQLHPLALSLSLSLILVYFPVFYDTLNNFFVTQDLYVGSDLGNRFYNLVPYYLQGVGVQYMTCIFLYTFTILIIYFHYMNGRLRAERGNIIVVLFVLFTLNIRDLMDLNRTYLAVALLFYALVCLLPAVKTKLDLFFVGGLIVLSVLVHEAVVIPLSLVFLAWFVKSRRFYLVAMFFCFVLGVLLSNQVRQIFLYILDVPIFGLSMVDEFRLKALMYIESEKWGFGAAVGGIGVSVNRFLTLSVLLAFYFVGYRLLAEKNQLLTRLVLLILALSVLAFNFHTLFERLSLTAVFFSMIFLVVNRKTYHGLVAALGFLAMNFVWEIGMYQEIYTSEYNSTLRDNDEKLRILARPLYMPTPMLLNIGAFGNSDDYLLRNGYSLKQLYYFD